MRCVETVEMLGLDNVGIYRIPGSTPAVQALRDVFIKDSQAAELVGADSADVNNVASLLKLYFRELPEPLFTNRLYRQFLDAVALSNNEEAKRQMIGLLAQLPQAHLSTTIYVFEHLRKVLAHRDQNKMTAQNIATCFGPTLLTPSDLPADGSDESLASTLSNMQSMGNQNKVIIFLLQHPEVLDACSNASSSVPPVQTFVGHNRRSHREESAKATVLFSKYDTDHSGTIDFEEFRRLCYDMVRAGVAGECYLSMVTL